MGSVCGDCCSKALRLVVNFEAIAPASGIGDRPSLPGLLLWCLTVTPPGRPRGSPRRGGLQRLKCAPSMGEPCLSNRCIVVLRQSLQVMPRGFCLPIPTKPSACSGSNYGPGFTDWNIKVWRETWKGCLTSILCVSPRTEDPRFDDGSGAEGDGPPPGAEKNRDQKNRHKEGRGSNRCSPRRDRQGRARQMNQGGWVSFRRAGWVNSRLAFPDA